MTQLFTMDNTDGFRFHELRILNDVAAEIRDIASFCESDIDEQSIADAISNAWLEKATVEEIVSIARARLGI
jgi:hypothetical protein